MFVTDERGGGIVPPGASCAPGIENPYGNGGAHAYDISDPANIKYATTPEGEKAVYISDAVVAAETFCDIHVIEQIPGEQRLIAAYYSQGIKIVDYYVDDEGHLQFVERSSFTAAQRQHLGGRGLQDPGQPRRHPDLLHRRRRHPPGNRRRELDRPAEPGRRPRAQTSLTNAGLAGGSAAVLGLAGLYRFGGRTAGPTG